jgi:hypothetical protein
LVRKKVGLMVEAMAAMMVDRTVMQKGGPKDIELAVWMVLLWVAEMVQV